MSEKTNLMLDVAEIELQKSIQILRVETPKNLKYAWEAIHTLESILSAIKSADGASRSYE